MTQSDTAHRIRIVAEPRRVRVRFAGRVIADSRGALALHEPGHPAVCYLPCADVDMTALEASDRSTHCPHKGDARYWSIRAGDRVSADAVWCYESPFPAVAAIAGHLAFYPSRVDAIDVDA